MLVEGSCWWLEVPGFVVASVVTICYLFLVPPYVLGGDNGEFALLAHVGGIAHPPGYPFYVLVLRLFHWLPASSPAQAAGFVTAVIAGLQMLMLYAACRCWGAPALAGAMAVGFYAGSPLSLQHFTQAEVFALNGLIVAALLLCGAPLWPCSPVIRLGLIGLLCGFGLSHHHSFVLVLPLIVFGLICALLDLSLVRRPLFLLWLPAAFMIGLLPNLLLFPWSQGNDVYFNSWKVIRTWSDFLHHWLRRDYGTFSLASAGNKIKIGLWSHMVELCHALVESWKFLIVLTPLPFGIEFLRFRLSSRRFRSWMALLMSLLLAGPVFFSRANVDPYTLVGGEVVERFYLLPNLLLAIPISLAIGLVSGWMLALIRRFSPSFFGARSLALRGIIFCCDICLFYCV